MAGARALSAAKTVIGKICARPRFWRHRRRLVVGCGFDGRSPYDAIRMRNARIRASMVVGEAASQGMMRNDLRQSERDHSVEARVRRYEPAVRAYGADERLRRDEPRLRTMARWPAQAGARDRRGKARAGRQPGRDRHRRGGRWKTVLLTLLSASSLEHAF